jgi:hypothetical protein
MNPHSGGVVVYPSGLSTAQEKEIATIIYKHIPIGIYSSGDDVLWSIKTAGVSYKSIRFNYAVALPITIAITLEFDDGYSLVDVEQAVIDGVTDYINSLPLGKAARRLEIGTILDGIPGIVGATMLLDGIDADYIPNETEKLTVDGVVAVF